jgi:leucyl/phenylalanyl-tRNA--protein transferase
MMDQLTPEMIVWAYRRGLFPMADSRHGRIGWYSPDPRAVLPLDEGFHIPRSLRRRIRREPYSITYDAAFEQVIHSCARPRSYSEDTWINDQIIEVFIQLHRLGIAHSVEAWRIDPPEAEPTQREEPALVGGLYGLAMGGAFFGESMFSRATDASKVCLVRLVERLREQGFTLLDTQIANEHMQQFGLIEIPRTVYLRRLKRALEGPHRW